MQAAEQIDDKKNKELEKSSGKGSEGSNRPLVLIIPPSRIGDAILASGTINAVIEKYDNPLVTVAAPKLIHDLFLDTPGVNEIIPFEKKSCSMHWPNLWRKCIGKAWAHILDLRGSGMSFFLTSKERTIWKKGNPIDHKVKQVSKLIGKIINNPIIWLSDDRIKSAKNIIGGKKIFVISPAANWLGKQWPVKNYCQIIKHLHPKDESAYFVIISAPHEADMVKSCVKVAPENTIDLTGGETDLLTLAAIIKQSKLFLGNDSGLMHMSAAVGTKTIGLFGPTDNQVYGPWNNTPQQNIAVRTPESRPKILNKRDFSFKSRDKCYMTSLSVDKVWKAVESVWFER